MQTPVGRPVRIGARSVCVQVLYALTAGIAGYVSAVQYKTMGGTNWVSAWLLLQLQLAWQIFLCVAAAWFWEAFCLQCRILLSTSKVMLGLCQVVLWPVPVQEQQLFAILKRLC